MEERDIVDKLYELESNSYKIGNEFIKKISNNRNDARITTFYLFAQVIRSIKLYFILKSQYLDSRDWFVETYLSKWNQHWPYSSNGNAIFLINDHTILTNEFNQVM